MLKRVQAGQSLTQLSASTWNAMCDAVEQLNRKVLNFSTQNQRAYRQSTYVMIEAENPLDTIQPCFPYVVTGATWTSDFQTPSSYVGDDTGLAFANNDKSELILKVKPPSVLTADDLQTYRGRIVIPVEPIGAGEIGWAVIGGVVPCMVRRISETHRFVDIGQLRGVDGEPSTSLDSYAVSDNAGVGEIVWDFGVTVGGDFPIHSTLIKLGNKAPEPIKRYRLTENLAGGEARALEQAWNTDDDDWEDTEIEETISGAGGWRGYAAGSEDGGAIIAAQRDDTSGKVYAVSGDKHCEIGFYHSDDGIHKLRIGAGEDSPLDLTVTLLNPDDPPEEDDPIIAWYVWSGWVAEKYPFGALELEEGCLIEIETTEEGNKKISVKVAELPGTGLELEGEGDCKQLAVKLACGMKFIDGGVALDNETVASDGLEPDGTCGLKLKADCGISVGPDGVKFDNAAVAGTSSGLTTDGTCGLKILVDCGLTLGVGGLSFDADAAAGAGLSGSGCVLSVVLDPGCGISIDGVTISWDRDAVIDDGLEAVGTCGFKVKADCGITVGPDGVGIDRAALIDSEGGLEAGGGTCDLQIKVGCGVATDADGLRVYRPDLIQANGGLEAGSGTCDLRVKVGCGLALDATGVKFKNSDVLGNGLRDTGDGCGMEVKPGCGITVDANGVSLNPSVIGDGLEVQTGGSCDFKVKADCGISVSSSGVKVDRTALMQANGGLEAGSGTCDMKVKAGCGITVGSGGVGVDRSALIQSGGGLATGSGTCDLKVDLSSTSPLWSGTQTFTCVSDVSWNSSTCVMTKTTKTFTFPANIPITFA